MRANCRPPRFTPQQVLPKLEDNTMFEWVVKKQYIKVEVQIPITERDRTLGENYKNKLEA